MATHARYPPTHTQELESLLESQQRLINSQRDLLHQHKDNDNKNNAAKPVPPPAVPEKLPPGQKISPVKKAPSGQGGLKYRAPQAKSTPIMFAHQSRVSVVPPGRFSALRRLPPTVGALEVQADCIHSVPRGVCVIEGGGGGASSTPGLEKHHPVPFKLFIPEKDITARSLFNLKPAPEPFVLLSD